VVANLSRFAQVATLDLSRFKGMSVVELFGLGAFPPIREEAYQLTLGAHNFFWCALQPVADAAPAGAAQVRPLPRLALAGPWESLLSGRERAELQEILPAYLQASAWFGGKARKIIGLHLVDAITLPTGSQRVYLTIWRVDYVAGESEHYTLPLAVATGVHAEDLETRAPEALVARLAFQQDGQVSEGLLYDAFWAPGFAEALLSIIVSRGRPGGQHGELSGQSFLPLAAAETSAPMDEIQLISGAQNNTSVTFGERLVLKLLRHVEDGISPELELGRFLQRRDFAHAPPLLGALEYRSARGRPATLAVLHRYVHHRGTGRAIALEALAASLGRDHAATERPDSSPCAANLLALAAQLPSASAQQLLGDYEATATLIGRRTAELHRTLATDHDDPVFARDSFTPFSRRALYQSFRNLTGRTLATLRRQLQRLPAAAHDDAEALLAAEPELLQRFHAVLRRPIQGCLIRIHGDYHLEQVLHTDDDLVIIDFEGEPSRPAAYRRLRRSPLHDVVAMVRSFFDASAAAVELDDPAYHAIAYPWAQWAAAAFLRAYQDAAGPDGLIPEQPIDLELLLDTFLLERGLYEVAYELDNRPERVGIPLNAVRRLLKGW
jgi:maltose alpha-D-glucosyltransferase / alpha-amylase